jgi:hypothetical protein
MRNEEKRMKVNERPSEVKINRIRKEEKRG